MSLPRYPPGSCPTGSPLSDSVFCARTSVRSFIRLPPLLFFFFHPSLFLSSHLSVLFFSLLFCLIFSLSLYLSLARRSSWPLSPTLSLSLSLSLSVSLYNLLISPLPFCVSETFLFNWLCFSFGLSGSFCLCLGFYFLLAAPLLVSQIPPVKPCYGHLTGHYKGLDAPRVLDPGSHH